MKIRDGFVSNSSSTSFTLMGATGSAQSFVDAYNKIHPESPIQDIYDLNDPDISSYTSPYGYDSYVGIDLDSLGEDETKGQLRARASAAMVALFGEDFAKVDVISESWYDG
jgi:hypothetical protein